MKVKALFEMWGSIWLQLHGFPSEFQGWRFGYNPNCFKPLEERKAETDISVFTDMLSDTKITQHEKEDA